jgi:DNA (cytosine-5)-methyltransferase 1
MSSVASEYSCDAVSPVESFTASGDSVRRTLVMSDGRSVTTAESARDVDGLPPTNLGAVFNDLWLRRTRNVEAAGTPVTIADLFSGCGGLSVGAHEAARATGHQAVHVLAADNNEDALGVFGENFPEAELHAGGIEELVDGDLGASFTRNERRLASQLAGLDIVMGGPPCQGHSDLNNHTRRADPRNALYLRMARFVEVVRPRFVLVENVPGVAHDKTGVVRQTTGTLVSAGYSVDAAVLTATDFGAAQSRRRHVLLATLAPRSAPTLTDIVDGFASTARTVMDAIGDLGIRPGGGIFDTPAQHSAVNERRINFLFDNNLWDLPNEERPDCHRLKPHSYVSVYGRMHANRPAPTITSGFGSTGQGRFVHPLERRTLTPHEAARLQGFPDWFTFKSIEKRGALQKMIGNAVPSRLAYAAIASLLR